MCRSETKCSNATRPAHAAANHSPIDPPRHPADTPSATPPPPTPPPPPSGGRSPAGPLRSYSGDWLVFRESFLLYLEPAKREAFRQVGETLFTKILSGDRDWPAEPWTHARLRALVLDLLFVVQVLDEVSREPEESEPEDRDEYRLAREAVRWAVELRRVARAMEEAVEEWEGEG